MVKSNIRCKDCIHCYGMNPPLNDRGRCSLVETEPNYVDTNMLWLCKVGFEPTFEYLMKEAIKRGKSKLLPNR